MTRVKLVKVPDNKRLVGFKEGEEGELLQVNYPTVGYSLVKWDRGMTTDSRNDTLKHI